MNDRTRITSAPNDDGLVTIHFGDRQPTPGYRIPTPDELAKEQLAAAERPGGRVHLTYTEPVTAIHLNGWTSPSRCVEDQETAEQLRDATNILSGPDAAKRRTWTITPCDSSTNRCGGNR